MPTGAKSGGNRRRGGTRSAAKQAPAPATVLNPSPGTDGKCKLTQELTSTGAVIEAVKNNASAIGYASLSSVEGQDGIKALKVGGVVCSEETVLDGSYTIQRPFVLVTKSDTKLSETAQKFFDYAISATPMT